MRSTFSIIRFLPLPFEGTAVSVDGVGRRVIENKEGSIWLFERWRIILRRDLCVAHHHQSRFPPRVSNKVGRYIPAPAELGRRVVCLLLLPGTNRLYGDHRS